MQKELLNYVLFYSACLFKFNFINMDMSAVNEFLKRYNLFTLPHRLFYRRSLFLYKITTVAMQLWV